MKILLAVDGSPFTRKMLAYVAAHDEWLGAHHQYAAVHVVQKIPPHAASFLARDALDAYYADESEKVLRPIRAFSGQHGLNRRRPTAARRGNGDLHDGCSCSMACAGAACPGISGVISTMPRSLTWKRAGLCARQTPP